WLGDEPEAGFGDPRAVAVQECWLEERRVRHFLVHELLDFVEDRFALLSIHLGRLLAKESVDVGVAAVGVHALPEHERLDPRRGVAERGAAPAAAARQLLFLIRLAHG